MTESQPGGAIEAISNNHILELKKWFSTLAEGLFWNAVRFFEKSTCFETQIEGNGFNQTAQMSTTLIIRISEDFQLGKKWSPPRLN